MVARVVFEKELNNLHNELHDFGRMVEDAIDKTIIALMNQDTSLAQEIMHFDDNIDSKEKHIERLCLMIIATQQPLAKDLRNVSTALKIITDMERIGDHASDISELTLRHVGKKYIKPLVDLPKMAEIARGMVKSSLNAYVTGDIELAKKTICDDDIVDDLFTKITLDLISLMKNDSNVIDQAIDLMLITKYFERIGDHATNIAEWAIYNTTGDYEEHVKRHVDTED